MEIKRYRGFDAAEVKRRRSLSEVFERSKAQAEYIAPEANASRDISGLHEGNIVVEVLIYREDVR